VTIAIVTGAASGIGAAIARRIAEPGVGILLHTRKNEEGLAVVAAEAAALGAAVETTLSDLSVAGTGTQLIETALDRFGGLDWVVANAGFADKRAITDLPDDGIQASFAPIVDSFFQIARAASPALRKSSQGRVVAISSFVAHRFPPKGDLFPASAAAKGALEALARALAAEVANDGVTVNIVAPGYTQKDPGAHAALGADRWQEIMDRIPLSRLASPEDCAAAVAYFLSEDAGYVTGQTIHVDGGLGL
jgi:NAD(P)-dependent dehydrogenase (short-subunit alcohol dehydrogenase family)